MKRSNRYKLQYFAILAFGCAVAFALRGQPPALLLTLAVTLLIPGRLSGYLWRDLYRGRRQIDAGDAEKGLESSERFLKLLAERPRLRGLWWLAWGTYTRDPQAMALNNIGSAHLNLGHLDEAETALREAIVADGEYAIPHSNLAVLSAMQGNTAQAETHARRAIELGYSRDAIDRLLLSVGSALAQLEGNGPRLRGSRSGALGKGE